MHHSSTVLCLNCYRTGHRRQDPCPNQGIVSCSKCFLTNVFSKTCNCHYPQKPRPPQALRLVGDSGAPRIFIDLEIHGRYFEALINTASTETQIGNTVLKWLLELGYSSHQDHPKYIRVPIKNNGHPVEINCKVQRYLEYPLEIGMDYICQSGFSFQMGTIKVTSKHSPIMRNPNHYDYLYNLQPHGMALKRYLERKGERLRSNYIDHDPAVRSYTPPGSPPVKRQKTSGSRIRSVVNEYFNSDKRISKK